MKSFLLLSLTLFCLGTSAQTLHHIITLEPEAYKENITVEKLSSDSNQSSYIIWVSDTVKPHYHAAHTECIYLLEGEGTFYLEEEKIDMKAGDFIMIPKGSVHSYKHRKGEKSKVLSIQTPQFHGKDRIWVDHQPHSSGR